LKDCIYNQVSEYDLSSWKYLINFFELRFIGGIGAPRQDDFTKRL
jgi:hypothetical protein